MYSRAASACKFEHAEPLLTSSLCNCYPRGERALLGGLSDPTHEARLYAELLPALRGLAERAMSPDGGPDTDGDDAGRVATP